MFLCFVGIFFIEIGPQKYEILESNFAKMNSLDILSFFISNAWVMVWVTFLLCDGNLIIPLTQT